MTWMDPSQGVFTWPRRLVFDASELEPFAVLRCMRLVIVGSFHIHRLRSILDSAYLLRTAKYARRAAVLLGSSSAHLAHAAMMASATMEGFSRLVLEPGIFGEGTGRGYLAIRSPIDLIASLASRTSRSSHRASCSHTLLPLAQPP